MAFESITWVYALTIVFFILMAYSIGANDLANAFGTSISAKALSFKQAIFAAAIFEFLGAFLVGSRVVDTVRSGILELSVFEGKPELLAVGMMCSLLGAALWLLIATYLKLPVSTTHCIVGAIIGIGIAAGGVDGIQWIGLGLIVLSWLTSPIISGIFGSFIFYYLRGHVLRHEESLDRAFSLFPTVLGLTSALIAFGVVFEGSSALGFDQLPLYLVFVITGATGILVFLLSYFIGVPFWREKVPQEPRPPPKRRRSKSMHSISTLAHEPGTDLSSISSSDMRTSVAAPQQPPPPPLSDQEYEAEPIIFCGITIPDTVLNWFILDQIFIDEMHEKAEKFDKQTERLFSYVQVMTACFGSFAHGSNGVANATAPISTVYAIYFSSASAAGKLPNVNVAVPVWVIIIGALGICLGLATFGKRVIETIGEHIAKITPSRGFAVEFSSAATVVIASRLGLPISTTHAQVGSVAFVGYLDSKLVHKKILIHIMASWVLSIPVPAIISALFYLLFSLGV